MASYLAIAAVGQALVNLLRDASRQEFPQAVFELFQASDFEKNFPGTEGGSVFLYRIGAHNNRRNLPPRPDADGTRYRPSLPVDLFFLITPWAAQKETQYRLLGWIMRTLEDTPILPAALLNEMDTNSEIFRPKESVEFIFDPLSLQDMSIIWENLKQVKILPSVTYVARMILLDSRLPMITGEPMQTREFAFSKALS
jgi:hypothetical protein